MKKTRFYLFLLTFVLVISSCEDEKTSKVRDIAKRFANAFNNGDRATIYELFPESKDLPNMSMAKSIETERIDINYVDSVKEYIVKYGNKQEQEIEIKDSCGTMKIIDSYHVFKLDSIPYELALITGVPVNKMSDIHLCDCMREGSTLMLFLQDKLGIDDLLKLESKRIEWEYEGDEGKAYLYLVIRNIGGKDIRGKDYRIEYSLFDSYTKVHLMTGFVEGKDVASGNLEKFKVPVDGFDNGWEAEAAFMSSKFVYNNLSLYMQFLKYGVWYGNEYNLSLKNKKMVDEMIAESEKKVEERIAQASIKKFTNKDLEGLNKSHVELLRNSIFAKHGYIFNDLKIREYFNNKSWYKEKTTDMNKIYNEFNDVEKYNVDFIIKTTKKSEKGTKWNNRDRP